MVNATIALNYPRLLAAERLIMLKIAHRLDNFREYQKSAPDDWIADALDEALGRADLTDKAQGV
jgi:hypothetical protein